MLALSGKLLHLFAVLNRENKRKKDTSRAFLHYAQVFGPEAPEISCDSSSIIWYN